MLFEATCNWSRVGERNNTNLSQPQASLSGGYGPIKRFGKKENGDAHDIYITIESQALNSLFDAIIISLKSLECVPFS